MRVMLVPFTIPRDSTPSRLLALTRRSSFSTQMPLLNSLVQFKKDNMLDIAEFLNGKYGEGTVEVEIKDSYRNMLEKIKPHFHLVETARKATRMAGLEPEEIPVRGGTDGAMLSWKGLPCPNLGTGGFNFHGVCECITAERMDRCTEILLNIISLYAE